MPLMNVSPYSISMYKPMGGLNNRGNFVSAIEGLIFKATQLCSEGHNKTCGIKSHIPRPVVRPDTCIFIFSFK